MNQRGKITLMLFFFSVCGSAPFVRYYWNARPNRTRPAELYAVVYSQLSAFRVDDYARAYRQASANFQNKFNIEQFAEMIRTDYSPITRSIRVEFGPVEFQHDHAFIQVFFIDADGRVLPCLYSLVDEGDAWKIDGARMLRRWSAGVRLSGLQS